MPTAPGGDSPATTQPGADGGAVTTYPSSTTDTTDPEMTDQTIDPVIDEAPREDEADADITVPPPPIYQGSVSYQPAPVLWSNVAEADAKVTRLETELADLVAGRRSLLLRAKQLRARVDGLETDAADNLRATMAATDRLKRRAVGAFLDAGAEDSATGGLSVVASLRGYEASDAERRKAELSSAALTVDQEQIDYLEGEQQRLSGEAREVMQRLGVVSGLIDSAAEAARTVEDELDQSLIEREAFRAGSEVFIDGVVFPIQGDYGVPLIDSFGFPRMPGTADAHAHEGIDIFAPRGSPLVATERGVLSRIGVGRLGGLKLWLTGESGTAWYYAHLDSFAPGIANGMVVEAGDLLGYVGNTGNAVGTPPHLHMELHPGGGRAVNPYPLLAVVSAMEREALAQGVAPARRYEPVVVERPDPTTTETSETDTTGTDPDQATDGGPTSSDPPSVTVPTTAAPAPGPTSNTAGSAPTPTSVDTSPTVAATPTTSG